MSIAGIGGLMGGAEHQKDGAGKVQSPEETFFPA
jgi:hypothetical protein